MSRNVGAVGLQPGGHAVWTLVRKELSALAPLALAALASIGIFRLSLAGGDQEIAATVRMVTILGFTMVVAALGAFSVGHEYIYQTLPVMLALPGARRRLLVAKYTTLGVCLAAIVAAGTWTGLPAAYAYLFTGAGHGASLLLPFLCGLLLAPAAVVLTRSAIGGALIATLLPGAIALGVEGLGQIRFGTGWSAVRQIESSAATTLWASVVGLGSAGFLVVVRSFGAMERSAARHESNGRGAISWGIA